VTRNRRQNPAAVLAVHHDPIRADMFGNSATASAYAPSALIRFAAASSFHPCPKRKLTPDFSRELG
jgi:hypothetical protein